MNIAQKLDIVLEKIQYVSKIQNGPKKDVFLRYFYFYMNTINYQKTSPWKIEKKLFSMDSSHLTYVCKTPDQDPVLIIGLYQILEPIS